MIPLPKDFPGDTAAGAAILATKLLPVLKKRFPGSPLPKNVFADRRLGFFHPNGAITAEWQAGLAATKEGTARLGPGPRYNGRARPGVPAPSQLTNSII